MKIFIGCSSSDNIEEKYFIDSKQYISKLLEDNDLLFGASIHGLMGLSYNIALHNKRKVTGICPLVYKDNFKDLNCNLEVLTNSVNERTEKLIKECDALVFLPGGVGTIYEFFTALESKRANEFNKPIILYNSCNYYDKLNNLFNMLCEENFNSKTIMDLYHISDSIEDTMEYLEKYYNKK